MIDIEQRPLRRLEENALSLAHSLLQERDGIADKGAHPLSMSDVFLVQLSSIELSGLGRKRQQPSTLSLYDAFKTLTKMLRMKQLAQADGSHPVDLVLVARPNPAAGRA